MYVYVYPCALHDENRLTSWCVYPVPHVNGYPELLFLAFCFCVSVPRGEVDLLFLLGFFPLIFSAWALPSVAEWNVLGESLRSQRPPQVTLVTVKNATLRSQGAPQGDSAFWRGKELCRVSPLWSKGLQSLGRNLSASCQGFILFQHEDLGVVGWSKVW